MKLQKWLIFFNLVGITFGIGLGIAMPLYFSKLWQIFMVLWMLIFAFLHILLRYMAGDRDWLSLDKIFSIAYIYWHFDYLLTYLLGLIEFRAIVISSPYYANLTTYLISGCLFLFLFGYDLAYWPRAINNKLGDLHAIQFQYNRTTMFLGKLLILVGLGLILFFIFDFGIGSLLNRRYGFNIFNSGEFETITFTGGKLVMAGGIMFLFIDIFHPRSRTIPERAFNYFLLVLVTAYSLTLLVLFSVRSWVLVDIFLPGLLSFHYLRHRISFKWLLVVAVFFVTFAAVVELSRGSENRDFSHFYNELQKNFDLNNGQISNLFTLQWRTYRNVNEAITLIHNQGTWFYGKTLISGFLAGIPVVGKYITYGWFVNPDTWLSMEIDQWSYLNHEGIGFSLPAEMYINFGLIGSFIGFLLLGYCCAKLYKRTIICSRPPLALIMIYLAFTPNLLFSIRQTITFIGRPVISTIIFVIGVSFISAFFRGYPKRKIYRAAY